MASRMRLQRLARNSYFRVGAQLGVGTIFLLAVFSTPHVWNSLSLDPVLANPSLILMLFALIILINLASGLAPLQLAAETCTGSLLGGGVGLACIYLSLLANGGSSDNTVTKAAVNLAISATAIFPLTLLRFKYRRWNLFYVIASLTLAIDASASYHASARQYKFTLYWWAFAAIGGTAALLCTTLVLPLPAGVIVRKNLAKALRAEGRLLPEVVDLITGEVNEAGLLLAASGETGRRIGIDSGLSGQLEPIYEDATICGASIQGAYRYLGPAKLELDVYRAQHVFPGEPHRLLSVLCRSTLSTSMMLVYPVQTGRMHCALCRRHREQLLALAGAFRACCDAIAEVLEENAPIGPAVERLQEMETFFAALSSSVQGGGREGDVAKQNALALHMVLSLLFTVCTRVRRMYVLLPGALGKDQPGAVATVLAHFHATQGWNFHTMTQVPPERTSSLDLLRASLLNSGIAAAPKCTPSAQAVALLAQPSLLKVLPVEEGKEGWQLRRAGRRLWMRTGFSTHQLKLGLQMVVAFSLVMVLVMITEVNNAVGGRLYWALFVVVAILEPSTGSVIFKAVMRFVGTVLGGAAGLGATYFTLLCNGLNYDNRPQKFIIMTLSLGLLSGSGAAAAVRFPMYSYAFTIAVIILCVVALPGYSTPQPMPIMALWRLVTTAIGIAVEVLVATLVFPITARDLFEETMAATLEHMATLADTAFHSVLPRPRKDRHQLQEQPGQQQLGQPGPGLSAGKQAATASGQARLGGLLTINGGSATSQPTASPRPGQPGLAGVTPLNGTKADMELCSLQTAQQLLQGQPPAKVLPAPEVYPLVEEETNGWNAYPVVEAEEEPLGAPRVRLPWPARSTSPPSSPIASPVGNGARSGLQGRTCTELGPHLAIDVPAGVAGPLAAVSVDAPAGLPAPGSPGPDSLGGPACSGSIGSREAAPPPQGTPSSNSSTWGPPASRRMPLASGGSNTNGGREPGSSFAAAGVEAPELWPGSSSREGSWRKASLGRPSRAESSGQVPGVPNDGLQRGLSDASRVASSIGGLSVYVPLGADETQRVFGTIYMRIVPEGMAVGADIVSMLQLEPALRYEFYPFHRPHRFPLEPGYRAQRLCRHLLNVLVTFAITMDSQEAREVPALAPHAARVEGLVRQLQECLRSFAGLVRGRVAVDSAVELVVNLEQHAVRLFLALILEGAEPGTPPPASSPDMVQGLAFLAMMFNAAYVARLLCIALVQTFRAQCPADLSRVGTRLGDPARWAVDDALMLVASGVMGVALGTASDPGSPRRTSVGPDQQGGDGESGGRPIAWQL